MIETKKKVEEFNQKNGVDLLLLMDCTGSMKDWIDECKDNLLDVMKNVREKCNIQSNIRIAYIGYRDIGDEGADYLHMDVIDFTTDHEEVKLKIASSKAFGG